ncbi:LysR family transcriptional regulator [Kribbella sp. NPDC051952]|uniref:LysR family transcriptional regulator n=1 Tax=Kribbella sp. NPDC051952 TaxID=3154851 RepID=UPI00342EC349
MLDVRRMQILRAVVSSGSVTAAAGNLGYTPSAISQQIATLEKEAGIALLERVGRGVRPTAAGRLLTEHAAVIGQQVADAETALAELRAGRTGRLTVRYFATAGSALMPPAMARFRRDFPAVHVDLKIVDPDDPLVEVERDRADLAIVVRPAERPRPGIRLVHLLDDPYRAVLPRKHRLAAKRVIDLTDLADEPWVNCEQAGACLDTVLDACAAAGFTPRIDVESDDYASAQAFVAAGLGISLMPQMALGSRPPGIVIRPVRHPEPIRPIYAALRNSAAANPPVTYLLEALQEAVRC